MAYDSPLFQGSLELLSHSIEHFNGGTERDRKFVIMHLANSVELIFKDLLLDLGESIYKNPKETITVTTAIETLTKEKNVPIPHLNKLELLIDERNSLQHRYGFPNELTTIFYMDSTYKFFSDFLRDNYALEIQTVLRDFLDAAELESFFLRQVSTKSELDKLAKLANVHPVGALLSANAYFEAQLNDIREIIRASITDQERNENRMIFMRILHPDFLPRFIRDYEIDLPEELKRSLFQMRDIRNTTAHGREVPTQEQAQDYIALIKELEPYLKILKEKVTENPRRLLDANADQKGLF